MKEIWKAFCEKVKESWNNTRESLKYFYNDMLNSLKGIMLQFIDLLKDLFANSCKVLENVTLGLVINNIVAFFSALYDSIMYGFEKLKDLFTIKD